MSASQDFGLGVGFTLAALLLTLFGNHESLSLTCIVLGIICTKSGEIKRAIERSNGGNK